jgi:DNA-binding GntR family transcriptional regulator
MLYQSLLDQLRLFIVYTPRVACYIEASLQEHRRLVELARSGDLAALETELAAHWERSKERIFAGYTTYLQDRAEEEASAAGRFEHARGQG